ncbi:GatB/YqeY domain-containing protein [Candidatus Woesebacteria bacterium]|nr:GatB/YqeY domain-containing protein [Candidatus Woesebacteria bacterium]
MIKQTIQADQIAAMKAKESDRLATLRYILAQIKNKEIEKRVELTDSEIVDILRKENKKLVEAAVEFRAGNREDLAQENETQSQIIATYLPQELSDAELTEKVQAIIDENRAVFEKNPSAMIGICIGRLKSEADSSRIAAIVKTMK